MVERHYELFHPGIPKTDALLTYRIETSTGKTWKLIEKREGKPGTWMVVADPDSTRVP